MIGCVDVDLKSSSDQNQNINSLLTEKMSSKSEYVKNLYVLYSEGNIPKITESLADDMETMACSEHDASISGWKVFKGKDGFLEMLNTLVTGSAECGVPVIESTFENGNEVLALGSVPLTRKSNGNTVSIPFIHRWRLSGEGKCSHMWEYVDAHAWARIFV